MMTEFPSGRVIILSVCWVGGHMCPYSNRLCLFCVDMSRRITGTHSLFNLSPTQVYVSALCCNKVIWVRLVHDLSLVSSSSSSSFSLFIYLPLSILFPSASATSPTGTKPDERPSRSTLPVSSQSTAKPLISSTTAPTSTSAPSDAVTSANGGVTAAPKPPAMRSRALSLQARTAASSEPDLLMTLFSIIRKIPGWFQCFLLILTF